MKKSILVLLFGAMVLSSCAQYTCPTYSKDSKAPVEDANEERLEERI